MEAQAVVESQPYERPGYVGTGNHKGKCEAMADATGLLLRRVPHAFGPDGIFLLSFEFAMPNEGWPGIWRRRGGRCDALAEHIRGEAIALMVSFVERAINL